MTDKPNAILHKQPHWDDPNIPNPEGCSSSDGVTVYDDGSACCYACMTQLFPNPRKYGYDQWEAGDGAVSHKKQREPVGKQPMSNAASTLESVLRLYEKAKFKGFPDRKISIQTAQFYGVKTDVAGNVYFPYYSKSTKQILRYQETPTR